MADEVSDIRRRRYIELCKQAAAHGYSTDPVITLEITDLRKEFGPIELLGVEPFRPEQRRSTHATHADLDIDFLISTTSNALYRVTQLESQIKVALTAVYVMSAAMIIDTLAIIWLAIRI